jgi:citrate synthase
MIDILKNKFIEKFFPYAKEIKELVKNNQDIVVDTVTLGQLYGGLRDVVALPTETSLLDANDGIRFRGLSIDDLHTKLPKDSIGSNEPIPEALFYLLLTGQVATNEEVQNIKQLLISKQNLPSYIIDLIKTLPVNLHPMIKFTTVLSALEHESVFNKAYHNGTPKDKLWEYAYEDAISLIAKMPTLVSYIYHYTYNNGKIISPNNSLDWAGNFAHMLGDEDISATSLKKEFIRLYMVIHSDHEGGNASANTAHLTGSTLASPFGAFAAGMHSLSGPLHGMATQNALDWLNSMLKEAKAKNTVANKDFITSYINNTIANKQVVPGYGHAVLRKTDPRFTAQMDFAKKHNLNSDLLQAVWGLYEVAPNILGQIGKIKNPFPNVDAHSGAMLDYFGFKNSEFYTVLFGASRALGIMAQQVCDRAFGHPLHRPKSVTSDWIKENILKK